MVHDRDALVSEVLGSALKLARSEHPNRTPLTDWLQTSGPCLQKEYVGILKHTLDQKPTSSQAQLTMQFEIFKYIAGAQLD